MKNLTIAFHSNQLSRTGTEVALYDYAHYAESLLGHRSVVLYHRHNPNNHPEAIQRFAERFDLHPYDDLSQLDDVLSRAGADRLYAIKAGRPDGVLSKRIPTWVHAVFPTAPWHAHGTVYAYVSEWLSAYCARGKLPWVPHIVDLPAVEGDLRAELGIPRDALVVGSYGGSRSFDVAAAREGLMAGLTQIPNLHAVFMHIEPFMEHPRLHFLPGSTDGQRKVQFIQTCDAMLHARLQGESFGLACGEFSIRSRPVMVYGGSKHRHHLRVLGSRALVYDSADDVLRHLQLLPQILKQQQDWDCYSSKFNPEAVMQIFDEVFISALHRRVVQSQCRLDTLSMSFRYMQDRLISK